MGPHCRRLLVADRGDSAGTGRSGTAVEGCSFPGLDALPREQQELLAAWIWLDHISGFRGAAASAAGYVHHGFVELA